MIIDGRAIASDILEKVRKDVLAIGRPLIVRAVVMSPNSATESYLRTKSARAEDAGMKMEVVRMLDDATTEDVLGAVTNSGADAIIVQLPLPELMNTELIVDEIPIEKDADVLSRFAYEQFVYRKEDALLPPVVGAIKEVLERSKVEIAGKKAVTIGSGKLVGLPASVWLEEMGADISVLTRATFTREALANADIIICGAGSPHLIQPDMLKKGVVLIDAGTSESNGALVGDADPACADIASVFTPVPGGMGPIAVACLFKNVAELYLRKSQKSVH
jgi:methylenetetrahydrofolate dehydrogenase (NADP+)/methenyltetrahydrofolate cyclohydrolase